MCFQPPPGGDFALHGGDEEARHGGALLLRAVRRAGLMNLGQFDKKTLKSIENEVMEDKSESDVTDASSQGEAGAILGLYILAPSKVMP